MGTSKKTAVSNFRSRNAGETEYLLRLLSDGDEVVLVEADPRIARRNFDRRHHCYVHPELLSRARVVQLDPIRTRVHHLFSQCWWYALLRWYALQRHRWPRRSPRGRWPRYAWYFLPRSGAKKLRCGLVSAVLKSEVEAEMVVTRDAGLLPSLDAVGSTFGHGQAESLDQLRHAAVGSCSFINGTHRLPGSCLGSCRHSVISFRSG